MPSTSVALHATRRSRRVVVLMGLVALIVTLLPGVAGAHGSVSEPASRVYHCFHDTDRFDPDLASTDPMCAQAWEAEPQALYDWPALLTTEGDTPYEDFIPDGEVCSAGLDKYAAFDEPGDWVATEVDNDFTVTFTSTAPHETEFYRIYVTQQGFDPTTDELTWGDLELVHETGQLPAAPEDVFEVSAPGRSGHHIVYLQWRRLPGHSPETFYSCSDVIFPGGGAAPEEPDAEEPDAEEPGDDVAPGGEPASEVPAPAQPEPEEPGAQEPVEEVTASEVPVGEAPAEQPPAADDGGAGGLSGFLEWLLALLSSFLGSLSLS